MNEKNDDENIAAPEAAAAEPETGSPEGAADQPSDDSGIRERPNHTADMAENQGKGDSATAANARPARPPEREWRAAKQPTAALRLDARIRDIEALLFEKEGHQMCYVYEQWPLPYYKQWKAEANELVALLVGLKHRRRAMDPKAG